MPRLEFELTLLGRKLRFDLGLTPIKAQPVLERIDGIRYELDTDAHRHAVARAQASADAKRAADAEAIRNAAARAADAVAHAEAVQAERDAAQKVTTVLETKIEIAQIEKQRMADEMDHMRIAFLQHELDERAN